MKIKSIKLKKATPKDQRLDKEILKEVTKKARTKNFGSVALSPDASEIDKMKYSIARDMVIFLQKSEMSQIEMAKLIGINKSRVSEVLHYRLSKFSLDTLVKYLFTLKGLVKEIDRRIADISDSFDIAS
jgi:predicted XRE-type DNA-binding protein